MNQIIKTFAPQTVLDEMNKAVEDTLTLLEPYKINLTNKEKKQSRTMSGGREGYVRMVARVATQFEDALGRKDNPEDLNSRLEYYDALEKSKLELLKVLETVQEIQYGCSQDIMRYTDKYVANLQISRNHETNLDLAMKDIDTWNKRFKSNPLKEVYQANEMPMNSEEEESQDL